MKTLPPTGMSRGRRSATVAAPATASTRTRALWSFPHGAIPPQKRRNEMTTKEEFEAVQTPGYQVFLVDVGD